jgi:N-methylhydantoinase A
MGHRDTLEIRRGTKPERDVFNMLWSQPEPLVPRYLRLDIDERLDYRGREVLPVNAAQVAEAAAHLAVHGVRAVAICFLFSYLNDEHEREVAAWLGANYPELDISLSSEILPQWREYERFSTTVGDAYMKPTMRHYLERLDESLRIAGFENSLLIMKSNGGVMTARTARHRPVETFLSGPAGGVVGGKYTAQLAGRGNVITIDMGGTSFDVSLISDGEFSTTTEGWVDPSTPLNVAMLDIRTIGAGGGSIAWIDDGGALKVGPQSAGAVPGPACYDQGGTNPTVTDANVVLGRIGPGTMLAGRLRIQPELARRSIETSICEPLGLDLVRAAAGIIRICVANMSKEIRALTAERGVDPRNYALLAGGGGGPLHAAAIAQEFGIRDVVIPAFPGLLSAGGLILSDLKIDRIKSFPTRIERDGVEHLANAVGALIDQVAAELAREGFHKPPVVQVSLDMRYVGQNWDINVPVSAATMSEAQLAATFDARHNQLYGFALPGHGHEVLSIRASAIGPTPRASDLVPRRRGEGSEGRLPQTSASRSVWDDERDGHVETSVYALDGLVTGASVAGPAIVEGMDSTIWVPSTAELALVTEGIMIMSLAARSVRSGRRIRQPPRALC